MTMKPNMSIISYVVVQNKVCDELHCMFRKVFDCHECFVALDMRQKNIFLYQSVTKVWPNS